MERRTREQKKQRALAGGNGPGTTPLPKPGKQPLLESTLDWERGRGETPSKV